MKILIVDDHPSVMEGTKAMLEKLVGVEVTLCMTSEDVLTLVQNIHYDIMIFDLYMPGMNGMELTKAVTAVVPDAVILIYTGADVSPIFNKLMDAGVSGFLSKTATQEQLITTVQCAARKEAVIPFSILKELRKEGLRQPEPLEDEETAALSEKDQHLLKELAKGKSNREMAEQLLMSQRSLEYGLTRLFQKLKVRSRIEAVQKAKQLGFLQDEDFV